MSTAEERQAIQKARDKILEAIAAKIADEVSADICDSLSSAEGEIVLAESARSDPFMGYAAGRIAHPYEPLKFVPGSLEAHEALNTILMKYR